VFVMFLFYFMSQGHKWVVPCSAAVRQDSQRIDQIHWSHRYLHWRLI